MTEPTPEALAAELARLYGMAQEKRSWDPNTQLQNWGVTDETARNALIGGAGGALAGGGIGLAATLARKRQGVGDYIRNALAGGFTGGAIGAGAMALPGLMDNQRQRAAQAKVQLRDQISRADQIKTDAKAQSESMFPAVNYLLGKTDQPKPAVPAAAAAAGPAAPEPPPDTTLGQVKAHPLGLVGETAGYGLVGAYGPGLIRSIGDKTVGFGLSKAIGSSLASKPMAFNPITGAMAAASGAVNNIARANARAAYIRAQALTGQPPAAAQPAPAPAVMNKPGASAPRIKAALGWADVQKYIPSGADVSKFVHANPPAAGAIAGGAVGGLAGLAVGKGRRLRSALAGGLAGAGLGAAGGLGYQSLHPPGHPDFVGPPAPSEMPPAAPPAASTVAVEPPSPWDGVADKAKEVGSGLYDKAREITPTMSSMAVNAGRVGLRGLAGGLAGTAAGVASADAMRASRMRALGLAYTSTADPSMKRWAGGGGALGLMLGTGIGEWQSRRPQLPVPQEGQPQ